MKKEAKLLLNQAIDSLILAIEHFNRPWDRGRSEAVMFFLDHSFEMLLKANIIHKGGKIRERRAKETIGFDHCVRKCLTDAKLKCLNNDKAITLRIINEIRDSATHYLIELSEQQLYFCTQAGVTLFDDLIKNIFNMSLANYLPERVLPISTKPPTNIILMMDEEFDHIKELLVPGKRRGIEARSMIRPIAIIENVIKEGGQPSESEIKRIIDRMKKDEKWLSIFPGISSLKLDTSGYGLNFSIRISKKEGLPVKLVKEGTEETPIVAVKRVSETNYYSLGCRDLVKKLNLTQHKTLAIIKYLQLQDSPEYYKEIKIGSSIFKRYSEKALNRLKEEIPKIDIKKVWSEYYKNIVAKRKTNIKK